MIEQKISKKTATPVVVKAKAATPHPVWTFAMGGDYGPCLNYLTNANGDRPVVMVRANGRGLTVWVSNPPWGCGDHRREFPGADLSRETPHVYAQSLVAMLRDLGIAKRDERREQQDRRRGGGQW